MGARRAMLSSTGQYGLPFIKVAREVQIGSSRNGGRRLMMEFVWHRCAACETGLGKKHYRTEGSTQVCAMSINDHREAKPSCHCSRKQKDRSLILALNSAWSDESV